jgi:hypothetical protein
MYMSTHAPDLLTEKAIAINKGEKEKEKKHLLVKVLING